MKGPGHKLHLDVRRTWRCPACRRERKLLGDVTSLICNCREGGTFMAIVTEKTVAPRPQQPTEERLVRSSEFGIDDLPVLSPHPSSLPAEHSTPRRPRPDSTARGAEARPETESTPSEVGGSSSPPPATPLKPEVTPTFPAKEPEDDWGEGIL